MRLLVPLLVAVLGFFFLPAEANAQVTPAPRAGVLRQVGAPVGQPPPAPERWVQNHRETTVWSESRGGQALAPAPQWTYFRVTGPQRELRVPVHDARTGAAGWLDALDVGPSGPPPPPPAPPPPVAAPRAAAEERAAPAPARPARRTANRPSRVGQNDRWIEVDLRALRAYAVVGDTVVYSAPITAGKAGFETPRGTFTIGRRVQRETMDSATVGIARDDAEGYLLKDVLYTQYFAEGGYALHANYWQPGSVFGNQATSHGCVGMQQADAAFFWEFGSAGTVVLVH